MCSLPSQLGEVFEQRERNGRIAVYMLVRSARHSPSRVGSSGVKSLGSHLLVSLMSAFCLDLQAVVSAPLELDSDCLEPRPGRAAPEPAGFQGHPPRQAGSGGLGTALEEELAMITGDRGDEEEELPDLEAPAVGHNTDLLLLFRQKEKDLVLAAKLGKALLERNQDLTKQYEKMHKDLNEKLEVSKQERKFNLDINICLS